MTRCPKCKKENYAAAVSSGVCAWCGYKATLLDAKHHPGCTFETKDTPEDFKKIINENFWELI